jgi:uncharacterized protein YutE (UPF0331/DUF86 family)
MIDKKLIQHKIGNIQNCLASIKTYTNNFNLCLLEDIKTQDAVVVNIERAIQSTVDIANHICSEKKLGAPVSMKDTFILLAKHNIITSELKNDLVKMIGFRNIAVHSYDELDLDILKAVVGKHLINFEDFYQLILKSV